MSRLREHAEDKNEVVKLNNDWVYIYPDKQGIVGYDTLNAVLSLGYEICYIASVSPLDREGYRVVLRRKAVEKKESNESK